MLKMFLNYIQSIREMFIYKKKIIKHLHIRTLSLKVKHSVVLYN